MPLTVVKYRKSATGETTASTPAILIRSKMQTQQQQQQQQTLQQFVKKPVIKLQGGTGLIINKLPASIKPANIKPANIKPAMKRSSTAIESSFKPAKYSLQTIASTGTPLTSFQWQQTIGGPGGTTITTTTPTKKQQIGAAISSLPPNTIIQATGGGGGTGVTTTLNNISNSSSTGSGIHLQTNGGATITPAAGTSFNAISTQGGLQVRRPTIYIKREVPKRTIRTVTLELIEKNPYVHLGLHANRLALLKNVICAKTNVPLLDCYVTLKKLRQNEEFALLAEYFEMSEAEVQHMFVRSVVKLAAYLRYLIRWQDSRKYYDRHKTLPFAFRSSLSHVQSLIECVETDMLRPMQTDCNNYKFILSITPNGIISYLSEAFVGHHDDLTIFNASNFKDAIPKYLSLMADPGKAIRRRRKPKRVSHNQQRTISSSSDVGEATDNSATAAAASAVETDSTTDSADESADDLDVDDNEDGLVGGGGGRTLSRYAASRVAGELASHQTMNVVNSELTSRHAKDLRIPTMRVREPACRLQIRQVIDSLREYKILQPYGIQEPLLYAYLNEILVVAAALVNLQR